MTHLTAISALLRWCGTEPSRSARTPRGLARRKEQLQSSHTTLVAAINDWDMQESSKNLKGQSEKQDHRGAGSL